MLDQLKSNLVRDLKTHFPLSETEFFDLLQNPKHVGHGQICLPVFAIAKVQKKAPPQLAQDLAEVFNQQKLDYLERAEAVSGFVNFHFKARTLTDILMKSLEVEKGQVAWRSEGAGRRVVIDYASPNVAKPMSIGHMRATMIGQAVCNLARSQGYTVVGLNHLGDWGSQFGKLAWAYQKWGHEYKVEEDPIAALFQMYVRFQTESEADPKLAEEGARTFKRLEDGDPEITALWKWFVEISMKDYQRLFDLLGVKHDLVLGESFYNNQLKPTEKLIEAKGLLVESEGAMVVQLEEEGMPPCLIRKSDGASLYATRDIASALYRKEQLKADLNLYVVGVDQTLHFRQVFKVLEKMGYAWSKDCHHVSFGMYRFKEGRMSTRKGNVIFLEDVLDRAIELVREVIEQKNPGLEDKEKVARQVGVGAIIFNDLANDRVKNVDFDWDQVLNFEGDSGPYVQYVHVRCLSLIRKYAGEIKKTIDVDLDSPEELELIRLLLTYQDVLRSSFTHFKPHILAGYLLDLCRQFSQFYAKHRILGEKPELEQARMTLVYACQQVLVNGLGVLNIPVPEYM